MRILSIYPEPRGSGRTLARFDLQLTDDIRLYGLKLVETVDGHRMVYPPKAGGFQVATFSSSLANSIARAAGMALPGGVNARTCA